jgi:iron complex transport system substrate-binding protein
MSGFRKATYFVLAIVLVGVVGVLIAFYLPMLQATLTKSPKIAVSGKMRIVSLSPGVTEMLFLLGVGDSMVGATEFCDYPPEAKKIERVGGLGTPSLEKLLALSPDLIVASGLERNDVLQVLRQSGVQVLKTKIESIDEMFEAMRQLGRAVGKEKRADEVIASMQAELKKIAAQSDGAGQGPRVFVELWDDPLTTVGANSFVDDVVSRAGGVNVAHELPQPYLRISPEKVIEWNPDVIVVAHMKRSASSPAAIGDRIGWSDVKAVREKRVYCDISTDFLLRPGPRLIEGVKILSKHLREATPKGDTERKAAATKKAN